MYCLVDDDDGDDNGDCNDDDDDDDDDGRICMHSCIFDKVISIPSLLLTM